MKTLKEQTDAKIEAGRKAKPEFMKGVDAIISKAKAFEQGSDAIKVGQKAPSFELPNPEGKLIALETLLDKGKKIINYPILSYWLDIGKHEDFEKAQEDIKHIKL